MLFLCVFIFLQSACSYDITATSNNSLEHSDIFNLPEYTNASVVNNTKVNETKSVSMERITQPSQTQQIERTLEPQIPLQNSSVKATKKTGNFENFKPSPLLDIQYEFNKFPVKPALPEAKTFGSFHDGYSGFDSWTERPVTAPGSQNINQGFWFGGNRGNSWDENSKFSGNTWVDKRTTTEQTWISRVKFPTTPRGSAFEKPYQFVTNDDKLPNYPVNFPITTESFPFNKPVEVSNNNNKPTEGFWDKLMSYNTNKDKNPGPVQKTFFDYNLLEKPPHYDLPKEHEHGGLSNESNPWKKVIKLLTTIIPIGLLISALTPTVITVTSVNDTQSRYRADDPKYESIIHRLASSQSYIDKLNSGSCEEKILCELLVNASTSKNYEEHIENILNTFTENEDLRNKKEALLKVFEAVKKEDCSSIFCRNIKNPT